MPFMEMPGEHGSEDGGGEAENFRRYKETRGVPCKEDDVAIRVDEFSHGCGGDDGA